MTGLPSFSGMGKLAPIGIALLFLVTLPFQRFSTVHLCSLSSPQPYIFQSRLPVLRWYTDGHPKVQASCRGTHHIKTQILGPCKIAHNLQSSWCRTGRNLNSSYSTKLPQQTFLHPPWFTYAPESSRPMTNSKLTSHRKLLVNLHQSPQFRSYTIASPEGSLFKTIPSPISFAGTRLICTPTSRGWRNRFLF